MSQGMQTTELLPYVSIQGAKRGILTHFAVWGYFGIAPACNIYAEYDERDPSLVSPREKVTCKRCMKTRTFRAKAVGVMTAQQFSLIDGPGRVHRDAHDTEIAAAEAFPEIKGEQRLAVLRAFVDAGSDGLTDYECHLVCGMHRPHIAGTRREELMAAGVPIVKTDQRRPTDTGALAIVWALDARHSRVGNGADITLPRPRLEAYSPGEAIARGGERMK